MSLLSFGELSMPDVLADFAASGAEKVGVDSQRGAILDAPLIEEGNADLTELPYFELYVPM